MVGIAFIAISGIAFLALIILVIYIRICGNHPPREKTRTKRYLKILRKNRSDEHKKSNTFIKQAIKHIIKTISGAST